MRATNCAVSLWLLLSLVCILACPLVGASSYAVRPLPPENQEDQSAWYFDLVVEPGQQQVLKAVVMNMGDEEIEVAVEANAASTNRNGVIEFVPQGERDASMTVDFSEILVPVEPVVVVPPQGETVAEFTLSVPDEEFDGVIYGGLMFTKLNQEAESNQGGMGVTNIFRYAVGTRLKEGEPVEPTFELAGAEMGTGSIPSLVLELRNPVPVLARGIEMNVAIYPQDGGEPIARFVRRGIDMAPNSTMPYTIDLYDEETLFIGNYRVEAELKFGEDTWMLEAPLNVG